MKWPAWTVNLHVSAEKYSYIHINMTSNDLSSNWVTWCWLACKGHTATGTNHSVTVLWLTHII